MEQVISNKAKCIVRLYVIEAFDLKSKDLLSPSDPYLKIILGDQEIDERDKHQNDTYDATFYSHYDIPVEFPGNPLLQIQVYDYDFVGDDLIGETIINLEDRYYSPFWNALKKKPIEERSLYCSESSTAQGKIRLWLEIFDPSELPPAISITPQPPAEFELRVVIWETKDVIKYLNKVECFDPEGTSDLYVRGFLNSDEDQHTDTHLRCQTGKGSFNWRMVFPVTLPLKNNTFSIQVWDMDIFSFNDYIASCPLDLSQILNDAFSNSRSIHWNEKYHKMIFKEEDKSGIEFDSEDENKVRSKFWIPLTSKDSEDPSKTKQQGSVMISVDVISKAEALSNPVGKGRDDPNHDPYLPAPVGRIYFSLCPCTMLNQCVGREVRCKIYCICCIIYLIVLFIWIGPSLIGNFFTAIIIKPIFGQLSFISFSTYYDI